MTYPKWFNNVCPAPEWRHWFQPASLRTRGRRYALRTDGRALFAYRDEETDMPALASKFVHTISGWLRKPAPRSVDSAALMDFLMAACASQEGNAEVPVGIGPDVFNARLLLRDLSQIEDMPVVLRLGETAQRQDRGYVWVRRDRERVFSSALITAPQWRYVLSPLRSFDALCWRLEDAAKVRP